MSRLRRLLAAAATFAVLVMALVASLRDQRAAGAWVTHTSEVKAALGAYLVSLLDAETGQRGYVITGKPEYLEPYTRADVGKREDALRALTSDNSAQQENMVRTSKLAAAKLDELRYVIELRGRDPQAAMDFVKNDRGKMLMDQIREAVASMVAEEDHLFSARTRTWEAAYIRNIVLLVGASGALGLTVLRALQLRRDLAAAREKEHTTAFNNRFVAVLGHDLKNPLTAIRISAERLEARAPPELSHMLARIHKSVVRMSRMIDQLLDVTRMRVAGGISLNRKDLELAELVREVVEDARARSPEKRIQFSASGDTTLSLDRARIERVVTGLVANAVTYGTGDTPIEVAVRGDADRVVLSVTNAGSLGENDATTLFDPFRRDVRDAGKNPRSEALGLGLAIARHVVERHGGRLDVTTGETTVFSAVFPR